MPETATGCRRCAVDRLTGLIAAISILAIFTGTAGPALANDGAYEATFEHGGRRLLPITSYDVATNVHLRRNGHILVTGNCRGVDNDSNAVATACAAELDSSGFFTQFGTLMSSGAGRVTLDELEVPDTFENYVVGGSTLDRAERLIFAVSHETLAETHAGLVRLSADGRSIDARYIRPTALGETGIASFRAVTIDGSGRVLAVGEARLSSGVRSLLLMRFTDSLQPDTTFGAQGSMRLDFGSLSNQGVDIAIDSQGRILVLARQFEIGVGSQYVAVFRFLPGGNVDTGFGSSGYRSLLNVSGGYPGALAIDSADRPVILGSNEDIFELDRDLFVARLDIDGNDDPAFNPGPSSGLVLIEAEDLLGFGGSETAGDLVIQPNGKIVLVGGTERAGLGDYFFTMRLLPSGWEDPSYGVNGVSVGTFEVAPAPGLSDRAASVALDDNGSLLVAGTGIGSLSPNSSDFGIARLGNREASGSKIFRSGFE